MRLEERLISACQEAGLPTCSTANYWSMKVPQLFCYTGTCLTSSKAFGDRPAAALAKAFEAIPKLNSLITAQAAKKGTTVQSLLDTLLQQTVGSPWRYAGALVQ